MGLTKFVEYFPRFILTMLWIWIMLCYNEFTESSNVMNFILFLKQIKQTNKTPNVLYKYWTIAIGWLLTNHSATKQCSRSITLVSYVIMCGLFRGGVGGFTLLQRYKPLEIKVYLRGLWMDVHLHVLHEKCSWIYLGYFQKWSPISYILALKHT